MIYCCFLFYFAIASVVQGALQDKPLCPRKRGLSEGLAWAQNRIHKRHLYKLNARKAASGFVPEGKYKLRVHTTYLRRKFDDALISLEALDERCGTGSFIVDDPSLFSPEGCPDFVATQTKEPMGRADVFWKAPKCGCVNIRVRVHSEGRYYLDDAGREEGPLSRRVCPREKSLWSYPVSYSEKKTRKQQLKLLCNVIDKTNSSEVAQSELFSTRRNITRLTDFEQERLETALELRSAEIKFCCGLTGDTVSRECFGDVRRRRIDKYCGTGETDIPLSTSRMKWIKNRKSECCWQIGEARYHCFNYTLYQQSMLRDGPTDETKIDAKSLDEFDPANDIDDYTSSETHEKKEDEVTPFTARFTGAYESSSILSTSPKPRDLEHKATENNDESNEESKITDESNEDEEEKDLSEEDTDDDIRTEDINKDRILSPEECCHNGITAGTRVEDEGLIGCFRIAEEFASIFTHWNRRCDRSFVVCCMRVVDGQLRVRHSKGRNPFVRIFSKTSITYNHRSSAADNTAETSKLMSHNMVKQSGNDDNKDSVNDRMFHLSELSKTALVGLIASVAFTSTIIVVIFVHRLTCLCSKKPFQLKHSVNI